MRVLLLLSLALLCLVPSVVRAAPSHTPTSSVLVPQADTQMVRLRQADTQMVRLRQADTQMVRMPRVTPQMRRYSRIGYALYFFSTAYSALILWGVLATGFSAKLRALAERVSRRRFVTLLVYLALLTLTLVLVSAPLTYYAGYELPHAYGLSREGIWSWLGEVGKGRLLNYALRAGVLWLLFVLIRRSPRRWAFWFWGALIPLIAFGIFFEPLLIDPLFNKFTPMPPGPTRTRIEALAARAGIPNAPIYVVDKSRQTLETNAYVTGIGASARIVIWDTTLKMPPDQVDSIMAHEMGHAVLGHIPRGFLETVGLLLLILPLGQKVLEFAVVRFGPRWRLTGLTDPAAVPLFLLVLVLGSFLLEPLTNGLSRQVEHEADAFGLHLTGNGPAMARSFVTLSEQNLSEPDPPPFIRFWLFDHPTLRERIDFALGKKSAL